MNARGTARRVRRGAVAVLCATTALTMVLTTQAAAEPAPAPEPTATATAPVTPEPTETAPAPAPEVSITANSAGTLPVGAEANIWGTATNAPDTPVTIQVLLKGAWANTKYGRTDATGAYDLPVTYGNTVPGVWSYRALVTVAGKTTISPTVTITRISPTVTITASTTPTLALGAAAAISGTATNAPNTRVTVQVIVRGAWANTAYGTTDAAGAYRVPITYGSTVPGTYSYRTLVTVAGKTAVSPTVTITRSSPAVTITATTTPSLSLGAPAAISGTATNAPNTRVTVQVIVRGAWANTAYGTTDSRGAYRVPVTYGSTVPGTYSFRTLVTAGGRTAVSPTVKITRSGLDPRCITSGTVICASKNARKVYYVKGGKILKTLDARFGGKNYDVNGRLRYYHTVEGTYHVTRKVKNEVSYTYDMTPMPFSVYFYRGQAFHYSYGFARDGWVGDWGSHGCINLRDWAATEWLYNNSPVGTKVVIYK